MFSAATCRPPRRTDVAGCTGGTSVDDDEVVDVHERLREVRAQVGLELLAREAEHRGDLVRRERTERPSHKSPIGSNQLDGIPCLKLASNGGDASGKQGRTKRDWSEFTRLSGRGTELPELLRLAGSYRAPVIATLGSPESGVARQTRPPIRQRRCCGRETSRRHAVR